MTGSRTVKAALALGIAVALLSACSGGPKKAEVNTGAGWAPFEVVASDGHTGAPIRYLYEPGHPASKQWRICVVVPADTSSLGGSTETAISYGVSDQAIRENVSVRFFGGTTNSAQLGRLNACKSSFDAAIIEWVDPTEADMASLPVQGNDHAIVPDPQTTIVVGAPSYSYAALNSRHVVADPLAQEGVMSVQWAVGATGGLPGTVVVLPGSNKDSGGNPTAAHATAGLIAQALKQTSLKLVGTYYGADTLAVQRALVLKAMTEHAGLTYIIGTSTAAQAAGELFATMNTDRRPQAISLGLTHEVNNLIQSGGVAAAMSGSPVIQGRIALDRAVQEAAQAQLAMLTSVRIAPVPLPVDPTNVQTNPADWWISPVHFAPSTPLASP